MKNLKLPTGAELYALEQLARRERSRVQAEILGVFAGALKEAFVGIFLRPYARRAAGKAAYHG